MAQFDRAARLVQFRDFELKHRQGHDDREDPSLNAPSRFSGGSPCAKRLKSLRTRRFDGRNGFFCRGLGGRAVVMDGDGGCPVRGGSPPLADGHLPFTTECVRSRWATNAWVRDCA